jgi:hypothetical protein
VPLPILTNSVSPWRKSIISNGSPSFCATICENAVSWPWPWLKVPMISSTRPWGETRTIACSVGWPPEASQ